MYFLHCICSSVKHSVCGPCVYNNKPHTIRLPHALSLSLFCILDKGHAHEAPDRIGSFGAVECEGGESESRLV